jgi:pseudouridylate synthase
MPLDLENLLAVAPEIERALEAGAPVVALESSVIAQGLPHPHNLDAARRCEAAVREEGALPATIAVIDGAMRVGLGDAELERLAVQQDAWKLGARDLGLAAARGATGGTTVSATLTLAELAGIAVFATGGIGGVHRGDASDVSADLHALSECAVAVVCAGAKAILDLPRTLELLETLGVPVVGLRTGEFPAFYADRSGLPLEARVESERELAEIAQAHWELGGAGLLVVQPCPAEVALPAEEIERAVAEALARAERQNIGGKALTPFLLGAVAEVTQGRSRLANLALLENNARAAAKLAIVLAG